ncbi:DEKNAAC102945 [Brettanomyces naardenensis]|uniref:DEKNAAC102945 n=1 Tax=Brettanomyces naardenensis TaxID=13370 RepID=A0A448YM33_BRENA|nr:DEKNAAC102945 [Brettanomyces naardenensis]
MPDAHPDLDQYMDEPLRSFFEQVQKDKDYIPANHASNWSAIIPKLTTLIRAIISNIYRADFAYTASLPLDESEESIGDIIDRIQTKISTKFQDSPPFTILHLSDTLTFKSPGYQVPDDKSLDETIDTSAGLKLYKVRSKNLITKEDSIVRAENGFHTTEYEEETPTRLANIYAVRFLRAVDKIVSVQSSVLDVNKDLKALNVNSEDAVEEADGIRMTKIEWVDEEVQDEASEKTAESHSASPSPSKRGDVFGDKGRSLKRTKSISDFGQEKEADQSVNMDVDL